MYSLQFNYLTNNAEDYKKNVPGPIHYTRGLNEFKKKIFNYPWAYHLAKGSPRDAFFKTIFFNFLGTVPKPFYQTNR